MAIPVLCRAAQCFCVRPWQLPTPTPPAQNCVQCLQKSGKKWERKDRDSMAHCMNYLCAGQLLLLTWWGFFLIFPSLSSCLTFCGCLIFLFPYHFLSRLPSFPLCLYVPSPLFVFSFSLFFPYPSTFVKAFKFLLLLEIFLLSLSISSPISFPSLFPAVLPKPLLFLPSLPDFLFSAFFCAASSPPLPPNPLSIIPYLWLQVLQLQESETQPGYVWGCHMYRSHPASKGRRVLHVQVLGQWILSTGCGSFI